MIAWLLWAILAFVVIAVALFVVFHGFYELLRDMEDEP